MRTKFLGISIVVIAIIFAVILSFNPEILMRDGDSLDTGLILSKTIFASLSLLLIALLGIHLSRD